MNLKTNTRPRVINTLPRSGACTNRPLERLPCPFTTKPLNMYLRTTRALASYEGSEDDDISTMLSSSTSATESIATPTAPLLEHEEDRRAIMELIVELLHDNK